MKLYTGGGDDGFTVRADGRRVAKCDPQCDAVGTIDELSAHVGLCLSAAGAAGQGEIGEALAGVQAELLTIGAAVAAGAAAKGGIENTAVTRLERSIDRFWDRLPPLEHFILPGGCEAACRLHVARTVCRRAERGVAALVQGGTAVPASVLRYLNRLSDLLFALARAANAAAGTEEQIWQPQ